MSTPLLVVIQGAPGSGKTVLANKLRKDIDWPILGKDNLKELLFETISQSDMTFSRLQGAVAFDMLYAFAKRFLAEGQPVVIEGAFWKNASRKEIAVILEETGARYLELFCHVDEEIRQERFAERRRHSAHMDAAADVAKKVADHNYDKLELGDCVEVDTRMPIAESLYSKIVAAIKARE